MAQLEKLKRDFVEYDFYMIKHWQDKRDENPEGWDMWLKNEADKHFELLVSKYNIIQSKLKEEGEKAILAEKDFMTFFKSISNFYPLNIKYNIEPVGIDGHLFKIAS